jgi:transcriptional regulator with XRE-family HTH domain
VRLDPAQAGQDRQNLAEALRDLRRASGLSGDRLARRCGMSQSKVSRIETGLALPSVLDVDLMLGAMGVDTDTREDLLALARVANAEYQDIRTSVRRGLHLRQKELATLENNSSRLRFFLPGLITGLLQTPDYMHRALNSPVDPVSADRSRSIAVKIERQAVLRNLHKRFDFLLTESALRWQLCDSEAMAAQLDHLVSVSAFPNVEIGILPQQVLIGDGPLNGFVIYDTRLVTIELFSGQLILRDPRDIEYHCGLFDYFSEHALVGDDARQLTASIADDYRTSK